MQKVPILPTQPWQDGSPVVSYPTVAAVPPSRVARPVVECQRDRTRLLARLRHDNATLVRPAAIKAPGARTPKQILVRSDAERSRQLARLSHNQAVVLRGVIRDLELRGSKRIVVEKDIRRSANLARQRHDQAQILHQPRTGVPRDKTIKALLVRLDIRISLRTRLKRRKPLILRAPVVVVVAPANPTVKPITVRTDALRSRLKARFSRKAPLLVRSLLRSSVARSIKPITVKLDAERVAFRSRVRRRKPLILRAPAPPRTTGKATVVRRTTRSRLLARAFRNAPIILRSRGGVATTPGIPTIKSILVRREPRRRLLSRIFHQQPTIIRPPITGVPRRRTTKPIIVRTDAERVAQHARLSHHSKPVIVRPVQRVAHPIRSKILVKCDAERVAFRTRVRRRKPCIMRAQKPVLATPRQPFISDRLCHNSRRARLLHHRPWVFRSRGGQAPSGVIFIEPFDQPTPTGKTSSVLQGSTFYGEDGYGDWAYGPMGSMSSSRPTGKTSSSPTAGAFDVPMPIGEVDLPDPET